MVIFCRKQIQEFKDLYLISEACMYFVTNQKWKIVPTLNKIEMWMEKIENSLIFIS